MEVYKNPILNMDYPDPDIIRVADTYYMISTTMYFMPGGVILKSYDLANWEIVSYVYEELDGTPGQRLKGHENIYGKGMWAACLRYHKGMFYVCFVANDTHKTYLYQAENICGPWKKQNIKGFYHDCSLLFEDDKAYIVYGNKEIFLTELNEDLTGPKEGGLHRMIVEDKADVSLGYEGSHFYKINGKYYLFLIHIYRNGEIQRTEACYVSDCLEGEFRGQDILRDDMGFRGAGVAQGGIVDTPEGDWYTIQFQDRGAVGRIPVLLPVYFKKGFPVIGENGKIPKSIAVKSTHPEYQYEPLAAGDDFCYSPQEDGKIRLKKVWQWNHTPDNSLWSVTKKKGRLSLKSGKICSNPVYAVNTLTQRMTRPWCRASVMVDISGIKEGDYAGICALESCFGMIAVTKKKGSYEVVMAARQTDDPSFASVDEDYGPGTELGRIRMESGVSQIYLRIEANFGVYTDQAVFFYQKDDKWIQLGPEHSLYFKLDHFTGCRFGLFYYSTQEMGGNVEFADFRYEM